MAQTGRYHGGLVIVGPTDGALDRLSRVVTATLEDYGHPVERQSVLSLTEARVISSGYMVKITLADLRGDARHRRDAVVGLNARRRQQMDHPAQRAVIEMLPVAAGQEDPELTELMLVVMLYRVADIFAISQVEWLSPETILTVDQFLGAFISVSPRRVRGRQQVLPPEPDPFAPVEDTEDELVRQVDAILGRQGRADPAHAPCERSEQEALAMAFRAEERPRRDGDQPMTAEEAENDIRRLAAWGMTGMLVFLSAPVAASMAAVNLVRGEDFRLNTHVLSLTGFLVVMQSSGALASVVSSLPL